MRPIKFRAWDDKNKNWLLGYEVPNVGGFSMFGECMLFGEWTGILNSRPLEELNTIKLMQYTGLKDKNGKDIYEGDLMVFVVKGRKDYWEIKWSEKGSWIMERMGVRKSIWGNGSGLDGNHAKDHEIIGNIYENPELFNVPS